MSNSPHKNLRFRPRVEQLDQRALPAQFGVPWPDSAHLTVSFAPDATLAAGESSGLFAALDAQMPRAVWQGAILRAFQTWSEAANLNVGVVADGGQAFGIAGPTQGDARFGDIRIGGLPMSPHELAVAVPPAAYVSGTLAGDIFINTAVAYTPTRLYAVALHEVGHALGIAPSTDRRSVMFQQLNSTTMLSASDLAAVRTMYGTRALDLNELKINNNSVKNATRLKFPDDSGPFDGATPLVSYGDLSTRTDVDYFALRSLPGYTGPATIRVQTTGISLMTPRMSIYNRAGKLLGQVTGTSTQGNTLTFTLPTTGVDEVYAIRVEAAPLAMNRIGRYAIAATFDGRLEPTAVPLDTIMRGAYDGIDENDLQQLFVDPNGAFLDDDEHTDDSPDEAIDLRPEIGLPNDRHFRVTASLADNLDGDFYRVRAPNGSALKPWVLTVSVHAADLNGAVPTVELFRDEVVPVPAKVLVNGNGSYTIQATGIAPRAYTFIRVSNPDAVGNYVLDVTYGSVAADIQTFAQGTLSGAGSQTSYKLYVGQTQLMSMNLEAGLGGAVRVNIVNSANQTVYSLTAPAGKQISDLSTMFPPGEYTAVFTALSGSTTFKLAGAGLTDPIGPVTQSSTLAPQYQAPGDPTTFIYPGGTISKISFLWSLVTI